MLNTMVIKRLSSERQPTEKDILDFWARIRADHLVNSISEAIEWVDAYFKDSIAAIKSDVLSFSLSTNPVFTMNMLDEALCSTIYHIFMAHHNKDVDVLSIYRTSIDEYIPILRKYKLKNDNKKVVASHLLEIFIDLSNASIPDANDFYEDIYSGKLANDYYCIMYFYCASVTPNNEYFDRMKKFYVKKLISG